MAPALRLALPKGRMQTGVFALLEGAGIAVRTSTRGYRPYVSLDDVDAKLLKPQNIVEMLAVGARDVGFAGADWIAELQADVVELLDTGLDPVRIVAAAPRTLLVEGRLPPGRPLLVASEYVRLTSAWIGSAGLDARLVRSYGATEAFPPDDADCIVDNTSTGSTLAAHDLEIVHTLMRSSTRLVASRAAMDDPARRARIEDLVLILRSVVDARRRVMLEVNVGPAELEAVVATLPCMRQPTIATLRGDAGFAVKVAVPRADLPRLIPAVRAAGGTDIVVTAMAQLA